MRMQTHLDARHSDDPTLGTCIGLYFTDLERRVSIRRAKISTLLTYRSGARLISDELLARPITAIRRREIRAWHMGLAESRRGRDGRPLTGAADSALGALASIFHWAITTDVADLQANPCHGIQTLHVTKSARALTDEELERWRNALDVHEHFRTLKVRGLRDGHSRMREWSPTAVLRLLDLTGARATEIRTLRVEHIDFERKVILLDGSKTDMGLARPLSDAACEALRRQIARIGKPASGLVFPGKAGKVISDAAVVRCFEQVCKVAGIEGACRHSLRHTMVTRGFNAGRSSTGIGAAAGHSKEMAWGTYRHALPPEAWAVVEGHARRNGRAA